jgi:hypothetical protein
MQNPGSELYDKITNAIANKTITRDAVDYYITLDSEQLNICRLLTLCLAILVTGNIMDNITGYERPVVVILDIAMATSLVLWASAFKYYQDQLRANFDKFTGDPNQYASAQIILHLADYLNYIIAGAQFIILNVQMTNWYSKSRIAYVLALFMWAQALGYITWINLILQTNWIKFYTAAVLFVIVAVFDYKYFYYTPTQANIFIGESTRSKMDRMKFDLYA